ncbi:MAG: HD-GYP domain-containing protein [Acidobacteria bacterium]|nr:HD-GYP domain-containing protein [Acidobacteriota bacterium]
MSKLRISLPTRIFLFSFVTVFLVVGAGFWTLNQAIRAKIHVRLKESFQMNGKLSDTVSARYRARSVQMLSVLSENAGLKAALGLLRELPAGQRGSAQVRRTIEANLFELGKGLEYQLMVVTDSAGHAVAGTVTRPWGTIPLEPLPATFIPSPLIGVQEALYEATTVPINLGTENLGSLTVAREFDIASWSPSGETALLQDGKIVRSTLPAVVLPEVESQIRSKCMESEESCEISLQGESYLALSLKREDWGPDVKLFGFQSLDAAMNDFTRDFVGTFLWIGVGGMLGALLLALIGAYSVSRPITNLILRLKASQQAGHLPSDFPIHSSIDEMNLLASTLNEAAQAVEESNRQLDKANLEFLETMARALDARDPYTAGHSDRVSANSTAIAEAMGLPEKEVDIIRIGAQMHDIGKIGIPDTVLQKRGPLNEEEFKLIKLHPQIGKRILEKVGSFQDYLPIVELHHEDYDGRGYPYGLTGEQVPRGVRIVHVADVYDAISSDRAYRAAMPPQQVLEILMRGSGTQFDPEVVRVFLKLLRERQTLDRLLSEAQLAVCYEEPSQP